MTPNQEQIFFFFFKQQIVVSIIKMFRSEEERKVEDARRKGEDAGIAAIVDGNEKLAHELSQVIREDILTFRCPRCKAPFFDFFGSFAITCTCGCGFCGWCLQDCGKDSTEHVRVKCLEMKGRMFASDEDFLAHQRQKQTSAINLIFQEQIPEVRVILHGLIDKDLNDLNIVINAA